jgi:hypothetical protein
LIDLFLPTNPTSFFGFLTVISVIGFVVGFVLVFHGEIGHLVMAGSAIGMLCFGPTFGLFAMSDARQSHFLAVKTTLTPVYQREFTKSCTQLGAVTTAAVENNCYDLDIFRVWAVGNRFYVGMINGDHAEIGVIFDRDGMIANHMDSIMFVSPEFDLQRIEYSFSRRS